jgi:hypothetical protein
MQKNVLPVPNTDLKRTPLPLHATVKKDLPTRHFREFDEHYDNLTPDQLMTIYSHQKMGFELWFVRQGDNDILAVIRQFTGEESEVVVIDSSGDVVKNPDIVFREQ